MDDLSNVVNELTLGGGGGWGKGLKIMENLKILDLRVVENYNTKEIIGREIPDSPPEKQDASELINRITALCVFIYFLL